MNFSNKKILTIIIFATLAVLGHWNFWSQGVYALGFNTTLFWLGLGALFWSNNPQTSLKKDWVWITPLFLMALSFSLFENPWLKVISCFILPSATAIFYAYSQLINATKHYWGFSLLGSIIKRSVSPFKQLVSAINFSKKLLISSFRQQENHTINKRIFLGIALLIPIAMLVLVLLSSADSNFNQLVTTLFSQFFKSINFSIFAKLFLIIVLSLLLLAALHTFKDPYEITESKLKIALDDVVVGIVMGGILIIYVLFLWLQLDYLVLDTLPQDFRKTEKIVKSGFWQLFFLSILNTALFLMVYKNTGAVAQIILRIFIAASGLLLLSAAWRMGMYVFWYGFSYEKFFASYTTFFALGVFIYLLLASFAKKRKDVFRIIAFAALWVYAIATVMPIEKIIFHSNVQLSQLSNSRIDLNHLKDLSLDIIGDVRTHFSSELVPTILPAKTWYDWLYRLERKRCHQAWYENNISLALQCP